MITQASNKRNEIIDIKKFKKMISSFMRILFLIIFIPWAHNPSQASTDDTTIITDHFVINFNIETGPFTFAIASRLEAYNSIISSFFEMDFLERADVFISHNKSKGILSGSDNNSIYISSEENFFDTEKKIYEDLFLIYLNKLMLDRGMTKLNKKFIEALISFPITEPGRVEFILSDLINVSMITSINFEDIDEFPAAIQQEIYTVFIHHLISNYGKKFFIQSLKDTGYYKGFFESLSSITGESMNKISEGFNLFLLGSRKNISHIKNNGRLLVDRDDNFCDVSFSVIDENRVAVLQRDNEGYRFLLKDRDDVKDDVKIITLKLSESGSYFNNIVSLEHNLIAITEIVKGGSKVYIFEIAENNFSDSMLIPLLFIQDINRANTDSIIFSAYCGSEIDIFTFNIKSRELKVITESGYNIHPVKIGNKIYYISCSDKNKIIEWDIHTGAEKILFATDRKISYLHRVNDKTLIYSIKLNGCDTNFTYDLISGHMQKIVKENCLSHMAQIFNKSIYYISLHKGVSRIFVEGY